MVGWNATALAVTGGNNVLIAISALGNGNLIVVGNEGYMNEEHKETVSYLIQWAALKNSDVQNAEIVDIIIEMNKNGGQMPANFIGPLVWNLNVPLSRVNVERLIRYVKAGGTLAVFITPWKYLQIHGRLEDATWYPLLNEAGIWPTQRIAWEIKSTSDTMIIGDTATRNTHSIEVQSSLALMSFNEFLKIMPIVNNMQDLPIEILTRMGITARVRFKSIYILKKWKPLVEPLIPCQFTALANEEQKRFLLTYNSLMNAPFLIDSEFKAPGVFVYPGEVSADTISVTQTQKVPLPGEAIPTGYYLPAGKTTRITVIEGDSSTCQLRVNFNLFDVTKTQPEFEKWPIPSVATWEFKSGIALYSPLGGLLWIQCQQTREFRYRLTNVVEAPLWDLRNAPSQTEWNRRRNAPGLWATIAADSVVIVVPSTSIRNLVDPAPIMKKYDLAFKTALNLAGYTTINRRREIMATDVQIKMGLMHSGYPIGISLRFARPEQSGYLFNLEQMLREGSWGLFHEQGHNLQIEAFVFTGSEEVSPNIFALRDTEVVTGNYFFSPTANFINLEMLRSKLIYPYYGDWKNYNDIALTIFAQLAHHFGWEIYRQFFRRYRDMTQAELNALNTDKAKIERMVIEFSEISNYNVLPLFDFWDFPVEGLRENSVLSSLPNFFPDDFVIQMSVYKHIVILQRYPNSARTVSRMNQTIGPLLNPEVVQGSSTFPGNV